MAKKKKSKKSISLLKEVDKSLNGTYNSLMEEIEEMQLKLNYADQKARKRAKKLARKKGNYYSYEEIRKQARMEVVGKMESNNFLERITKTLEDIAPIIVIISRLVAALILSILSLDSVKINIKPETLHIMKNIYNKAQAISV